jgi:hypothetical protein
MGEYTGAIVAGVVFGFVGRVIMLQTDYRQYPTYPHGSIIHLALGFIAAGLGSIAVPALFEQEYAAITFLALAASQFRDVRNMERNTLKELDSLELVSRGSIYIEGIAMAFEGRNYLVIFISFVTSLFAASLNWWIGAIAGLAALGLTTFYKNGKCLADIAEIKPALIRFDGPNLFVEDIHIMNIGFKESQELIIQHGMGFILQPKNLDSVVTLANLGQRQAVIHDLSVGLGVYRDSGRPSLVPLSKRDLDDGRIGVFFLPQIKNVQQALRVLKRVPVLENAVRMPTESDANDKDKEEN